MRLHKESDCNWFEQKPLYGYNFDVETTFYFLFLEIDIASMMGDNRLIFEHSLEHFDFDTTEDYII